MRPSLFVYDLAALGSLLASLVFFTALVYSGKFFGAGRPASWPPVITWLWRFAWMLWLVAVITFVVLRIQYPVDGDITITPMRLWRSMSSSSSPWAASLAAISSCGRGGSHSLSEEHPRVYGAASATPQPCGSRSRNASAMWRS